jgi:3-isopropylmalate/(R)-2-methylmalate dehydratase small subunit
MTEELIISGKVWKFGDDINTDIICPGSFLSNIQDPEKLGIAAMAGLDPDFHKKISKGDIIVAGDNFGSGSSRETAPLALKMAGVGAVVAESTARIFFRNAIAVGLPVIECKGISKKVSQGDELEIHMPSGEIKNKSKKEIYYGMKLSKLLMEILMQGGLIRWAIQHKIYKSNA